MFVQAATTLHLQGERAGHVEPLSRDEVQLGDQVSGRALLQRAHETERSQQGGHPPGRANMRAENI